MESGNNAGQVESTESLKREIALLREQLSVATKTIEDWKRQSDTWQRKAEKYEQKAEKYEQSIDDWREKYLQAIIPASIPAPQSPGMSPRAPTMTPDSPDDRPISFPVLQQVPPEATDLFRDAKSNCDAAMELAELLEKGVGGVKDPSGSLAIYRWLAAQTLSNDQLIKLLDRLQGSKEKEELCFQLASKSSGPGVALRLARCHRFGRGTKVDETKAGEFYCQARDEKDVVAIIERFKWFHERGSVDALASQLPLVQKVVGFESLILDGIGTCAIFEWLPNIRNFKLLMRSSEMNVSAFHNSCDNKGPTLVLVKTANGSRFGGFAADSWRSSGGWAAPAGTFIFILESPKQKQPIQLKPKDGNTSLMYSASNHGPTFGGGHDLCLKDSNGRFYTNPNSFAGVPDASYFGSDSSANFSLALVEIWAVSS